MDSTLKETMIFTEAEYKDMWYIHRYMHISV